jgi:hypothetical protein
MHVWLVNVYRRFETACWSHLQGLSCLALEDGTNRLSQIVGKKKLPTKAAKQPKTAKTSTTPRRKPEISHVSSLQAWNTRQPILHVNRKYNEKRRTLFKRRTGTVPFEYAELAELHISTGKEWSTLSSTNPKWFHPGLNPDLCGFMWRTGHKSIKSETTKQSEIFDKFMCCGLNVVISSGN